MSGMPTSEKRSSSEGLSLASSAAETAPARQRLISASHANRFIHVLMRPRRTEENDPQSAGKKESVGPRRLARTEFSCRFAGHAGISARLAETEDGGEPGLDGSPRITDHQ